MKTYRSIDNIYIYTICMKFRAVPTSTASVGAHQHRQQLSLRVQRGFFLGGRGQRLGQQEKWWIHHPYAPWCWNIYQHLPPKSPKCR